MTITVPLDGGTVTYNHVTLKNVLKGLEILWYYNETFIAAERGEIFAGSTVSKEDAKAMIELGWTWYDTISCWRIRV